MENKFFEAIKTNNSIVILRHTRPDLDALGSQLGLAQVLKDNYPSKSIYVTGDESDKYAFIGKMDIVSDDIFKESIVIVVDVAVKNMVSDERYSLAKEVFVVDHHKNECNITLNHLCDSTRASASEYLTYLLLKSGFTISSKAATCLLAGIITDSGRFMYGDNLAETLSIASKLISFGADAKYIYDNIYVEKLADREMKNYFSNAFKVTENGVGYLINKQDVFERFPTEFNNISRGMLSVMSGIEEISIWLNFTYDISKNAIIGEFRSRNLPIVDIAKSLGGGGHALACGATIASWEEVDKVIKIFDDYLKEQKA